jgi:chromosome segregation ATPase
MELRIPGGKTMSQLDRIEQMLLSMNERLIELEKRSKRLENGMAKQEALQNLERNLTDRLIHLEEAAAKQEDLLTAIDVLNEVTEEVAATAQMRTDAGYVTLESLFKGLEDRLANTKLELGQYAEKGFQEIGSILDHVYKLAEEQAEALSQMREEQNQVKKDMDQRFSQLSDIMRSWVYKQNLLDHELKRLKEKVDKISGDFEQ